MSTDIQIPPPPQKYSRYRSVRQAATAQPPPAPPAKIEPNNQSNGPSRSMSRYRRPNATSAVQERKKANAEAPPMPIVPNQFATPSSSSSHGQGDYFNNTGTSSNNRSLLHDRRKTEDAERNEERDRALKSLEAGATLPRTRSPYEDASRKLEQERLRQQRLRREEEMKKRAEEEEVNRLIAEQKKKDLERLELELEAAVKNPTTPDKPSPARELFSILTKKTTAAKPDLAPQRGRGNTVTKVASNDKDSKNSGEVDRSNLPGIDAPISAVNTGERRVLVRFKQSSISLPVLPETTMLDLAYSSANVLNHKIDPLAIVVLESYTKLGLERRVRRYEHVRDILNSWDRDTQNALFIEESDSPAHDRDLRATGVSKERPSDTTVYMYHSQKPGKWTKRYITLQSTGQIFLSKHAGSKSTDKDIVTICHLTDFDIYTPTASQMRKTLKPPKKHCHAIKSQQKTTMFLSTENFVHFFSTDDSELATEWYDAVQNWRSWYLIYQKGEGQKKPVAKSQATQPASINRTLSKSPAKQAANNNEDDTPYTIGTLKPLLDMKRFGSPSSEIDEEDENRPRQIPFHLRHSMVISSSAKRPRERHPPPVALTRKGYDILNSSSPEGATFAPSGLLGRTYTQRQNTHKEKETNANEGPFISGPSLLNGTGALDGRPQTSGGGMASRALSVRSKRPGTSGGQPNDPTAPPVPRVKPLIDLTPKFPEAPQWRTEGKGHGVAAPAGVPLVEVATTPDMGIVVPLNNVFRREDGERTGSLGKDN